MKHNAGMLSDLIPYIGIDQVMLDNGIMLPVTNTGTIYIHHNSHTICLDERNLVSIGQLAHDSPLNCEFLGAGFVIKNSAT